MIEKGLIVSIQNYSKNTIQELSSYAVGAGAVAIRTNEPIICEKPIIGLKKIENKEYYISTDKKIILDVQKWANYIAIDSRIGNQELEFLYGFCHINEIKIVADISNIRDINNILKLCNEQKINKPEYFATTFNFNTSIEEKAYTIYEIRKVTEIPIIAEGGYSEIKDIEESIKAGANNICIGTAISDLYKLTKKYKEIIEGVNNVVNSST